MSSSPIKFHVSDSDRAVSQQNDVTEDTVSMETESVCQFYDEDDEDCVLVSACDACDERERFALLDSPPVSVLTGKISLTAIIIVISLGQHGVIL